MGRWGEEGDEVDTVVLEYEYCAPSYQAVPLRYNI